MSKVTEEVKRSVLDLFHKGLKYNDIATELDLDYTQVKYILQITKHPPRHSNGIDIEVKCVDCGLVFPAKSAQCLRCPDCKKKHHKEYMKQFNHSPKDSAGRHKAYSNSYEQYVDDARSKPRYTDKALYELTGDELIHYGRTQSANYPVTVEIPSGLKSYKERLNGAE